MNNKSQKQDTSTLLKTRHFYFGLTPNISQLSKQSKYDKMI